MPRVIHFEIQAEKPDRAMTFYETLFGRKFRQWGDRKYWLNQRRFGGSAMG
jgi:uncharacterized protein